MQDLREEHRVGIAALETLTALQQRTRNAHPTSGLYEAAEIQFWWTIPRSTDTLPQLFWFDDLDRPAAAVTITDFGEAASLVYEEPTLERGLTHIAECGIDAVDLEADRTDDVTRDLLLGRGFTIKGDAVIECWLDADARPETSLLHDDYRLAARSDTMQYPHHMTSPRRPGYEERLGAPVSCRTARPT